MYYKVMVLLIMSMIYHLSMYAHVHGVCSFYLRSQIGSLILKSFCETILVLLRHSDYCISGHSSVDVKESVSEGEKIFDQLSVEERGKFDEETLVNVNNIKKKSATSQSSNELPKEYIVVTILLVVAHGVLELPPIKSGEELKKALQKLASIPSSNIMVRIICTCFLAHKS
ncbi:hypothetical protein Hdeb2414_s0006g00215811 [Helianthus debilis subsp. tardiflorus]